MSITSQFIRGIWRENPVLKLILGLCPALAVTTSLINGIAMGLATSFVLIMSNIVISLFSAWIPKKVRIPCFIIVIASFVTLVDLTMHAYLFPLWEALGLFIPLIVANCVILGRAEAFASKNGLVISIADGLGMGLGFTIALGALGGVREIFGNGTIMGYALFGPNFPPLLLAILPPGAFIFLGLFLAGMNKIEEIRSRSKGELPPEPVEADASRTTMVNTDLLKKKIAAEDEKSPQVA